VSHAIGLDIGGTSLKSVCIADDGTIRRRSVVPLQIDQTDWPQTVRQHLIQLEQQICPASAVGLAAPGIAWPDGRGIWWMQGRLAELETINWTEFLGRNVAVPVLNDAQAALLGEAWIGAAAGQRNVVLLTLGTGVGGAAIVDGHLLRGAVGRAGHIGHISLDPNGTLDITNCPGSLEDAVGNCTVAKRAGGRFASVLDLAAAAASGDAEAAKSWNASLRALAAGIASIVNVLDPQTVIIGGGIAAAKNSLFLPLSLELDRFEWRPHGHRVKIVPAALGEYAGAIGAAKNAMRSP
jgi:glucokinase